MKTSIGSLGRSTDKIVARIHKIKAAAKTAADSDDRFAEYRYLRSVLKAYRIFEEKNLLCYLAEIAPGVLKTAVRANSHPLRVIIDATCRQPDLRMRSRWTRALQYAVAESVEPEDLARFLRANNGIAGCADLASKTSKARIHQRRAVDGPPIYQPTRPGLQNPWKLF